jgi:hypothetical protein
MSWVLMWVISFNSAKNHGRRYYYNLRKGKTYHCPSVTCTNVEPTHVWDNQSPITKVSKFRLVKRMVFFAVSKPKAALSHWQPCPLPCVRAWSQHAQRTNDESLRKVTMNGSRDHSPSTIWPCERNFSVFFLSTIECSFCHLLLGSGMMLLSFCY